MSNRKLGDTVYYLDADRIGTDYIRVGCIVDIEDSWTGNSKVYSVIEDPDCGPQYVNETSAYDSARECALASLSTSRRCLEHERTSKVKAEITLEYLQGQVSFYTGDCRRVTSEIARQEKIICALSAALAESDD